MTTKSVAIVTKETRDATIASLCLKGMRQSEIAKRVGVHKSTVSRVLSKDTVAKKVLLQAHNAMMGESIAVAHELNTLCFHDDPMVKLKAIQQHQTNMGFRPSHTQNTFIQNIYNGNQTNILNPTIEKMISGDNTDSSENDDIIEGDIIDD